MGAVSCRGPRVAVKKLLLQDKRGFFFTAIAILVVAAIILAASSSDSVFRRSAAQTDYAVSVNSYFNNLQSDLPRVAYIAGFRSLIGLEEHISTTGSYLSDFDDSFLSIFTNGSVNGTYYSIMNDSTFEDFAARFEQLASEQGMVANLTPVSVHAYQDEPWSVIVNVTVDISLSDADQSVAFRSNETISARIPVTDIKDPVYTIGTLGRAPHTVKQAPFSGPYIGANNDTTKLSELVNETYYISNPSAPSFIMRFSGNLSPSPYGIQSLVNIVELGAQDVNITPCVSVVDYKYFRGTSTAPNNVIANMDSNTFWLSDQDLADYDATDSVAGTKLCP